MTEQNQSEPLAEETASLRAVVHGRVQGVGFRYFVVERARGLGLTGVVRNLPAGTVQCEASGPREKLDRLADELKRGPALARVSDVVLDWGAAVESRSAFEVGF